MKKLTTSHENLIKMLIFLSKSLYVTVDLNEVAKNVARLSRKDWACAIILKLNISILQDFLVIFVDLFPRQDMLNEILKTITTNLRKMKGLWQIRFMITLKQLNDKE